MSDQPERRTRQYGSSDKALTFIKQHANVIVSITEIAEATGLSRSVVSSAMNHLRVRGGLNIESPIRGQYIYHTGKRMEIQPRASEVYEVVGITRGYIIVRDTQGELFTLTPLADLIPKD